MVCYTFHTMEITDWETVMKQMKLIITIFNMNMVTLIKSVLCIMHVLMQCRSEIADFLGKRYCQLFRFRVIPLPNERILILVSC